MSLLRFSIIFCTLCTVLPGYTYRILGLFPYNGKSHFLMFERLMKGLAERGHRVDVVGHFPLKESFSNYNDIVDLSSTGSIAGRQNNMTYERMEKYFNSKSLAYEVATEGGNHFCESMGHPKFKKLVESPPKDAPYHLVITEVFGAHCYMAMGHHLGVPVVGIVTSAMWPWVNDMVANPDEPAYIPHIFLSLDGRMNFWQRMENVLTLWREKWRFNYYSTYQDELIRKHIGPHVPGVREAERNLSLILVNSHYSLSGVRPFTTAVVEVGGLHIPNSVEALPKNLQKWLDDSKDGFVYISFGSMLKIETFPKPTLDAMYASLAKLAPIRSLMKITKPEELPPGLPNNVLTSPWVPQLAVLKHKHARAFMTHGGLMGTQEAVDCGVPMIGVPLFADQGQNIEIYVRKNIAVSIQIDNLTEKSLDTAFNLVLHDPSYIKAAKKLSAEFRDRPMTPLDTAIFWVEYVVRNGGEILRSPAMDLTWWEISLLDVYGALLAAVIFVVYLLILIAHGLMTLIMKKDGKKVTHSKKTT